MWIAGGCWPAFLPQRAVAVIVVVIARLSYRKIPPLLCMAWALLLIAVVSHGCSQRRFLALFHCCGNSGLVVLPQRSVDRHFRHGEQQRPAGAASRYVSTTVTVFWQTLLVGATGKPGGCTLGLPYSSSIPGGLFYARRISCSLVLGLADTSLSPLWWLLERLPVGADSLSLRFPQRWGVSRAFIAGISLLLPRGFYLHICDILGFYHFFYYWFSPQSLFHCRLLFLMLDRVWQLSLRLKTIRLPTTVATG